MNASSPEEIAAGLHAEFDTGRLERRMISEVVYSVAGWGADRMVSIRVGLRHPDPGVREQCCKLLDHLLVEDAVEEMIAMLDDPIPAVRVAAVHALACDRCKSDACRPAADLVLAPGLRLLRHDPDAHVRAMAVELVGRFVDTSAEAADALVLARQTDRSPTVRKKAGWYAPGGAIHRRA